MQERQAACLGHSSINHKVGTIHKAGFVTGQEHDSMGLLDSFSESTRGKVHFATMTFGLVVT